MIFTETSIRGAMLISPQFHVDERGEFYRGWCEKEFTDHGIAFKPVQANVGHSVQSGTLRGMHYQVNPAPEAKLVRCVQGSMFDVVLDLRPESPSYLQWFGVDLTAKNGRSLYVPERCAHGYQTLENETTMHYWASYAYTPAAARGARHDDPRFGIAWPLPVTRISAQDRDWNLWT